MIVRSLDEARSALAAGHRLLESPPGAALLQGVGWWLALLRLAREEFGEFDSVLDCGDAPGAALGALRAGVPAVRLRCGDEVFGKVADMAAQHGARVEKG